jgi:zinc and cadmium transporter
MLTLYALLASLAVAAVSLIGVFFFGNARQLVGMQKYVIPVAVGVFLSLVLFDLIPHTVFAAPVWGGIVVAIGFIAFYLLAAVLHKKYHVHDDASAEECDKKGAATLLLIGDALHNVADGIVLGGAFLVNPAVGVGAAVGLMLHELPQEIVEFGVLVRAGYSRVQALALNFLSASSIFIGTVVMLLVAGHADEYMWILTGIAAGNLLYIAASDLLPRVHGSVRQYGGVYNSALLIVGGFIVMTVVLALSHAHIEHGHDHDHAHEYVDEHHEHDAEHAVHDAHEHHDVHEEDTAHNEEVGHEHDMHVETEHHEHESEHHE